MLYSVFGPMAVFIQLRLNWSLRLCVNTFLLPHPKVSTNFRLQSRRGWGWGTWLRKNLGGQMTLAHRFKQHKSAGLFPLLGLGDHALWKRQKLERKGAVWKVFFLRGHKHCWEAIHAISSRSQTYRPSSVMDGYRLYDHGHMSFSILLS